MSAFRIVVLLAAGFVGVSSAAEPLPTPKQQVLRVVVLPFQNATGDAALDDWCYALPASIRVCLGALEFTEVSGRKGIQAALERGGVSANKAVDARLAGQIARELEADVVVSGNFARSTNGWRASVNVFRVDGASAPARIEAFARGWIDLAESLTVRLAENLVRRIREDDRKLWRENFGTSEKAMRLVARAVAMEVQSAAAADREKVLRQALVEDARCGLARQDLLELLADAERNKELTEEIKEYVRLQPGHCEPHLWRGWVWMENRDATAAESELREALRRHRGCPGAARAFLRFYAPTENWPAAAKVLSEIHRDRPDANSTILLAGVRAQMGRPDDLDAVWDLLLGTNRLPEEDEVVDIALCSAAGRVGRIDLVGRELTRLGSQADRESINGILASLKLVVATGNWGSSNVPVTRPRAFTPAELNVELEQRLSAVERALAGNPVEITPEISAEARRITTGLSNNASAQAMALFAEVVRRGHGSGDGRQRTADESLQASKDRQVKLSCQEHAKLYVAMAQSIGIEAWMVHIERDAYGYPGYHDCAAIFLEGQGMLIDTTWRQFGVPHQSFIVMDDLQAISHHAMQPTGNAPDPRRLRAGLKLNPVDRWTRLQFVRGMVAAGEHAAAEQELRQLRTAGPDSWDVHEAAAQVEAARKRWRPALEELQRALTFSPSNALIHARLVDVYSQLDDPVKSKEHMELALRFDRGEIPEELRHRSRALHARLDAFTQAKTGDRSALDNLTRLAESGDLPAQIALAKVCFEARPQQRMAEGMRWLLQAAKQGDEYAQFDYGKNLLVWRGNEAGPEVAQWLTQSAGQGHLEAQYRLGLMFYEGQLVPRDNIAAGHWILVAAGAGNTDAKRLLKEMQLFLTADELAEARKRANTFKPSSGKTKSNNSP